MYILFFYVQCSSYILIMVNKHDINSITIEKKKHPITLKSERWTYSFIHLQRCASTWRYLRTAWL